MVFPQSDPVMCWDNFYYATGENAFNRDGLQMRFMEGVVNRLTSPKTKSADYGNKDYTWLTAYNYPGDFVQTYGNYNIMSVCGGY